LQAINGSQIKLPNDRKNHQFFLGLKNACQDNVSIHLQSVTKHFGHTLKIACGCNLDNPPHPPYNVEGKIYRPKCCSMTTNIVLVGGREGYRLYTQTHCILFIHLQE
jgi:hypothetical protein